MLPGQGEFAPTLSAQFITAFSFTNQGLRVCVIRLYGHLLEVNSSDTSERALAVACLPAKFYG